MGIIVVFVVSAQMTLPLLSLLSLVREGQGVDAVGGAEAIISHVMSQVCMCVCLCTVSRPLLRRGKTISLQSIREGVSTSSSVPHLSECLTINQIVFLSIYHPQPVCLRLIQHNHCVLSASILQHGRAIG